MWHWCKKSTPYLVKPTDFARKSSHETVLVPWSFQKAAGTWVLPMAHLQMQISMLGRVLFFGFVCHGAPALFSRPSLHAMRRTIAQNKAARLFKSLDFCAWSQGRKDDKMIEEQSWPSNLRYSQHLLGLHTRYQPLSGRCFGTIPRWIFLRLLGLMCICVGGLSFECCLLLAICSLAAVAGTRTSGPRNSRSMRGMFWHVKLGEAARKR